MLCLYHENCPKQDFAFFCCHMVVSKSNSFLNLNITRTGFFSRKLPKAYLHNFSTLNDKVCTEADRFDQNPSGVTVCTILSVKIHHILIYNR